MRGAVAYKGEWLAPNSLAFKLLEDRKFKELDAHLASVNATYRQQTGG